MYTQISLDEFISGCDNNEAIRSIMASSLLSTLEVATADELATFGNQVAGHKGKVHTQTLSLCVHAV